MAASLAPDDLGSLFDPYGGRVDLENGAVRVLHDGSFVDDPTRILRGITYEARYGFRFDEHTRSARSLLHRVRTRRRPVVVTPTGRIGRTARRSWSRRTESADSASSVSTLRFIRISAATTSAAALFARATALRDELALDVPSWRLGLAALARAMTADESSDWLDRLKVAAGTPT